MRYGIVNVKNVELMVAAHFCHFHRERQCIIGILEKSVIVDQHRMEKKTRGDPWHAERTFVVDEMHLMSTLSQFFAERRGKNAAPSNGRVTSNPNLQSAL